MLKYNINNFYNKDLNFKKIVLNLKLQKRPFLVILTRLLINIIAFTNLLTINTLKKINMLRLAIPLPHYLKKTYSTI